MLERFYDLLYNHSLSFPFHFVLALYPCVILKGFPVTFSLKLVFAVDNLDALRELVPFVQLKKTVKNTHGEVLLLVKLLAKSL